MNTTATLAGHWKRLAADPCGERYPEAIEFETGGRYKAVNRGRFVKWDRGTYEVISPENVRISLANDAKVNYLFELVDDWLEFTDPDGCRIEYERVR